MKKGKVKVNKKLNLDNLPTHIAIIMDGNGRWAQKRGLPRNFGHKSGCENLKRVVQHLIDLGIKCATFFTFSTENWKRPKNEIDGIFDLVREYLSEDTDQFVKQNVQLRVAGDYTKLPEDLVQAISKTIQKTANCTGHILNLAINYGSRDEIIGAVNTAIKIGKEINAEEFEDLLYSSELPPIDLVIRTSGEMRLSNFMLWQIAYSELFFTPVYWPDFSPKHLQNAIINFQKRKRRFGAL